MVLSGVTAELLADALPDDVTLADLGAPAARARALGILSAIAFAEGDPRVIRPSWISARQAIGLGRDLGDAQLSVSCCASPCWTTSARRRGWPAGAATMLSRPGCSVPPISA